MIDCRLGAQAFDFVEDVSVAGVDLADLLKDAFGLVVHLVFLHEDSDVIEDGHDDVEFLGVVVEGDGDLAEGVGAEVVEAFLHVGEGEFGGAAALGVGFLAVAGGALEVGDGVVVVAEGHGDVAELFEDFGTALAGLLFALEEGEAAFAEGEVDLGLGRRSSRGS